MEDTIFINPIDENKSLKRKTKEIYLSNIRYIQSKIMPGKSLYYILTHLIEFAGALDTYKKSSGKPLGEHSKDAFFSAMMSIFYSNESLREKNEKLFNFWKLAHDKLREPINAKYRKRRDKKLTREKIEKIRENIPDIADRLLIYTITELGGQNIDYTTIKIGDKIITSKLKQVIDESLKIKPRTHIFLDSKGKPYKLESMNRRINKIVKKNFGNGVTPKMIVDIFRN